MPSPRRETMGGVWVGNVWTSDTYQENMHQQFQETMADPETRRRHDEMERYLSGGVRSVQAQAVREIQEAEDRTILALLNNPRVSKPRKRSRKPKKPALPLKTRFDIIDED